MEILEKTQLFQFNADKHKDLGTRGLLEDMRLFFCKKLYSWLLLLGFFLFPLSLFSDGGKQAPGLDPAAFFQKIDEASRQAPPQKAQENPQGTLYDPSATKGVFFFPPGVLERILSLPSLCEQSLTSGTNFSEKIDGCLRLKNQIIYESPTGERIPFIRWTEAQVNRINQIYARIAANEEDLGLNCPDPRMSQLSTITPVFYYLNPEPAFDIYAAHVAHAIYLEANHLVPWSIQNLPIIQLKELFDFHSYFVPILVDRNTRYPSHIRAQRDYQLPARGVYGPDSLVCDPRVAYQFIRGLSSRSHENMLGESPESTLTNLSHWFKNNVVHGDIRDREALILYAYLSQKLRGRETRDFSNAIVANKGCHSAANLLYDLAKSVNIPLLNVAIQESESREGSFLTRTHRGLIFKAGSSSPLFLYHLDEFYANGDILGPIYTPIEGSPPNLLEEKNLLFQGEWVNPATLEAWGFHFFNTYPIIIPGEDYGMPAEASSVNRADYGYFAGYWEGTSAQLALKYSLEKSYQYCSYSLVSAYCDLSRSAFDDNFRTRFTPSSRMLPVERSLTDFYNRARSCVEAYGGCGMPPEHPGEAEVIYRNWERDFGSNTVL